MTHVGVIYASRHGATRGIADRVGEVLRERGIKVTLVQAHEAPHPAALDAIVLGSAAYMGKWLDEANAYVHRYEDDLRTRPVWLFSSGPVGTDAVDKQGHDLLEPPRFLREIAEAIGARDAKVFFGRWDPSDPPASVAERLFRLLPVSKDVLPVGDFRDWDAVTAWAGSIADGLLGATVAEPVGATGG